MKLFKECGQKVRDRAVHTSPLDCSELDLNQKQSERSNANGDRSKRV